jgi:hypothetical protein
MAATFPHDVIANVAPEIREYIPGISLIGNKSQEFLMGINPRNSQAQPVKFSHRKSLAHIRKFLRGQF